MELSDGLPERKINVEKEIAHNIPFICKSVLCSTILTLVSKEM